jgi:hypothetical protein
MTSLRGEPEDRLSKRRAERLAHIAGVATWLKEPATADLGARPGHGRASWEEAAA